MGVSFGDYELKERERELIGPGGPVELGARAFDLLAVLLKRPGELIGKSDLLDAVWPGLAVEENTLHVHMSALRKALGPGYVATVHGRGYRYVGPLPLAETGRRAAGEGTPASGPVSQDIRFCRAQDGVRIAYAVSGSGPPLVKTANWLNHLEHDYESPILRGLLLPLTASHRLVRYDQRGGGLSDWDVSELSLDAFVSDFEAVVEAAGLDRFPILSISQGCCIGIEYAARHPERVTHLVFIGGFARGWKHGSPKVVAHVEATMTMMSHAWGRDNPAFRQMFASMLVPKGTTAQFDAYNTLQKVSTSPANAVRLMDAFGSLDVRRRLEDIRVPTLVIHSRGDAFVPMKLGREIAAGISGAHFLSLDSESHVPVEGEPALAALHAAVLNFLQQEHHAATAG